MSSRDGDREARRTSFGAVAAAYDAARPDWPAATARWLTGTEDGGPLAGLGRRLRVADVGAGTGKLTRTLVALGHEVVAVDPDADMLVALRAAVPGTPTYLGRGEDLPLPDVSVDAVTVAQAWHWFDAWVAAAEIARVLRPGGVLGLGWHVRDVGEPWVAELEEISHFPRFDGLAALPEPPAFTSTERRTFRYEQRLTVEDLVTQASSWSHIALRDDRDAVLARVAALGERVLAERGSIVLSHDTHCYRFVRAGEG